MTPGSVSIRVVGEHLIQVVALNRVTFLTGRRQYTVSCISCSALLHAETAAPDVWISDHVHDTTEKLSPRERMTER